MKLLNAVQAHSSTVNRLRLTMDNRNLFSVGVDGLLCIFDVKSDARTDAANEPELPYSHEILTEKQDIDQQLGEKDSLVQELQSMKEDNEKGIDKGIQIKRFADEIQRLENELVQNERDHKERLLSQSETLKQNRINNET